MCEAGLWAKRKRRRVLTTHRDPSHPVAPNTLNRDFTAPEPNKKWVTDIMYIPTAQGWPSSFGDPRLVFTGSCGMVHVCLL
jgi:putative transposase